MSHELVKKVKDCETGLKKKQSYNWKVYVKDSDSNLSCCLCLTYVSEEDCILSIYNNGLDDDYDFVVVTIQKGCILVQELTHKLFA